MKNVKKMLTQHKSEILPDEKVKDNIKRELGMDEKQATLKYAHGGEGSVSLRRNGTLMVVCAAVLAAILVLGIFVSIIIKKQGGGDLPPFGNKFEQITDARFFLRLRRGFCRNAALIVFGHVVKWRRKCGERRNKHFNIAIHHNKPRFRATYDDQSLYDAR